MLHIYPLATDTDCINIISENKSKGGKHLYSKGFRNFFLNKNFQNLESRMLNIINVFLHYRDGDLIVVVHVLKVLWGFPPGPL